MTKKITEKRLKLYGHDKKRVDGHIIRRFNKIAIQGTPQMAVDKEARAYRESTHIVILSVPCHYTKCNLS